MSESKKCVLEIVRRDDPRLPWAIRLVRDEGSPPFELAYSPVPIEVRHADEPSEVERLRAQLLEVAKAANDNETVKMLESLLQRHGEGHHKMEGIFPCHIQQAIFAIKARERQWDVRADILRAKIDELEAELAKRPAEPPAAMRYWEYLDKYAAEHVTEASDFLIKLMCEYADRGTQLSESRAALIGTAVDFLSQWAMIVRDAPTKSVQSCDDGLRAQECPTCQGVGGGTTRDGIEVDCSTCNGEGSIVRPVEPEPIPRAWFRVHHTPDSVNGPSEPDIDMEWGDRPEGERWQPLYLRPAEPPSDVQRDAERYRLFRLGHVQGPEWLDAQLDAEIARGAVTKFEMP